MVKNCLDCSQNKFWCCFLRFATFYRSRFFQFVKRRSDICLNFWASKAAFWQNSVIIDFLENKMIFSQTKYAVTYFPLRPTKLWDISEIDFQLLPPYVWLLVTFALKFHLPCGLFLTSMWSISESLMIIQAQCLSSLLQMMWNTPLHSALYCIFDCKF